MTNLEITSREKKVSEFPGGTIFCVRDVDNVYIKLDDYTVSLRLCYNDQYPNAVSLKDGRLFFITNEAKVIEIKSATLEIET